MKSFRLIVRRGRKRSNIPGATGPFTTAAPAPRQLASGSAVAPGNSPSSANERRRP